MQIQARFRLLVLIALSPIVGLVLAGCQGYEVSVNDRKIYSPLPLLTNFEVADRNLQHCLDQHIEDGHITQAQELTHLNCSHAGIRDLSGLALFSHLEALDLSDNQLIRIDELSKLGRLRYLNLANNQLTQAAPLLSLLRLAEADLRGNPTLDCRDLEQLVNSREIALKSSNQCDRASSAR